MQMSLPEFRLKWFLMDQGLQGGGTARFGDVLINAVVRQMGKEEMRR